LLVAADYPFLDLLGTMVIFFVGIIWIWLLIKVFTDLIVRRHDLSGFAKACWLIFVMVIPFVGVFVYLIANNKSTGKHGVEQVQ
jgi:uncharacterized membrane protein YhaH (DUF805 family)